MGTGPLFRRREDRDGSVEVGSNVTIGGTLPLVIAGPCSVESRGQLLTTAQAVKAAGASILRGGAFKPRTSPYSFQGLGEEGLRLLAEAREATGLPIVTEVLDAASVELVASYADILQVGARNMQNVTLLKALGGTDKPVLLKRAWAATIKEWLYAAEYILSGGNDRIILCERGIRVPTRGGGHVLDINGAVMAKRITNLPVIADPSHAAGRRELVGPLAKAALAAGLDGIMVEVHPCPRQALSDAHQALDLEAFRQLLRECQYFLNPAFTVPRTSPSPA